MAHLRCSSSACSATFDLHDRLFSCSRCGDLLEISVDEERLAGPALLKSRWLERRTSFAPENVSGVWRFREFLPDSYSHSGIVSLGEGNTPVLPATRTADFAGVRSLFFKHLGWNPTGSFKDLGMTVGMTEAKYLGATAVGCASTGNTAASLAAYAARAEVAARVYLPAGQASNNKLAQALDFGAEIVEVGGNFDDALDQLLALDREELYFLNSINPFRVEGQKTAIIELFEQLEWTAPDYVVVPGGNLGNSSAFGKAFVELNRFGFIDRIPRLIVVQAQGANPFASMWAGGHRELMPLARPETAATAIRIGNPRSWRKALGGVMASDGMVIDVTDEEIRQAKSAIGRDGVGCEPASATTLAGIRKLTEAGKLDREARVVAVLTGHVLKDTDYIMRCAEAIMDEAATRR